MHKYHPNSLCLSKQQPCRVSDFWSCSYGRLQLMGCFNGLLWRCLFKTPVSWQIRSDRISLRLCPIHLFYIENTDRWNSSSSQCSRKVSVVPAIVGKVSLSCRIRCQSWSRRSSTPDSKCSSFHLVKSISNWLQCRATADCCGRKKIRLWRSVKAQDNCCLLCWPRSLALSWNRQHWAPEHIQSSSIPSRARSKDSASCQIRTPKACT